MMSVPSSPLLKCQTIHIAPYVCLLHAFIHLEYSSIFQNLFNNLESILIPSTGPDKKEFSCIPREPNLERKNENKQPSINALDNFT